MEPTFTEDWQEAQKRLRERLQARDDKILDIIRRGEQLTFTEWTEYFLENYSKPPMRAQKTHEANMRAVKHLDEGFSSRKLPEISVWKKQQEAENRKKEEDAKRAQECSPVSARAQEVERESLQKSLQSGDSKGRSIEERLGSR